MWGNEEKQSKDTVPGNHHGRYTPLVSSRNTSSTWIDSQCIPGRYTRMEDRGGHGPPMGGFGTQTGGSG